MEMVEMAAVVEMVLAVTSVVMAVDVVVLAVSEAVGLRKGRSDAICTRVFRAEMITVTPNAGLALPENT